MQQWTSRVVGQVAICACLTALVAPSCIAIAEGDEVAALPAIDECPSSLGGTERLARTIRKQCGPIVVTSTYVVNGSLTLEAGAALKFLPKAELHVGTSGPAKLLVRGTAQDPVIMTSADSPLPAAWGGVRLHAGARGSQISGLLIEDAGDSLDAAGQWIGALVIRAKGITLTGSKIRNAKGYGIRVETSNAFAEMSGNTFEHPGNIAIRIPAAGVASLGKNRFGIGDFIQVDGGTISDDARWQDPGVPYRIAGVVTVSGRHRRATLEIAAGTTLYLDDPVADYGFEVGDQGEGTLLVSGTPERPVVFTSEHQRERWSAITVNHRGEARIANAEIARGGKAHGPALRQFGGKLTVTGTTFETNPIGVVVRRGTFEFDRNRIAASEGPALMIVADQVGGLGSHNVYDKAARIEILDGNLERSATWIPQGVPYEVSGTIHSPTRATLTLLPGIELAFGRSGRLHIALRAIGTPDRPVTLRGNGTGVVWAGVELHARMAGELANVRLSDTGGEAAIIVNDGAVARLSDIHCARCARAVFTSGCNASVTAVRIAADAGTPAVAAKRRCR